MGRFWWSYVIRSKYFGPIGRALTVLLCSHMVFRKSAVEKQSNCSQIILLSQYPPEKKKHLLSSRQKIWPKGADFRNENASPFPFPSSDPNPPHSKWFFSSHNSPVENRPIFGGSAKKEKVRRGVNGVGAWGMRLSLTCLLCDSVSSEIYIIVYRSRYSLHIHIVALYF